MIRLNINEAKTHLSRYIKNLEQGEVILLCKHNKPVAEIRPLSQPAKARIFGIDEGKGYTVPPEFFEPLDDELLAYFNGIND
ncbi:MAG: type II toxin-antitoxin system Phd/YefM family antitoxin [Bryobacteraceae bacterium]